MSIATERNEAVVLRVANASSRRAFAHSVCNKILHI